MSPVAADKVVHFLAPVVMVVPVILAYAVLPVGRNMVALDLDAGVLFFFAVGGAVELAVFMAGWSSRNKYALLGAMRAIAQMISYEIPLILAAVPVIMIAVRCPRPELSPPRRGRRDSCRLGLCSRRGALRVLCCS